MALEKSPKTILTLPGIEDLPKDVRLVAYAFDSKGELLAQGKIDKGTLAFPLAAQQLA